ncbi:7-cyano-7-deazaguanine synthase QueC [Parerythrobacter jejuensis]|uniref:7-cyano-7-deazaguanine synthase n=1 Tax=Parerythrobacter jejuensis TaxID=795812 RepID=A0A845AJ91_9SPHN|nr:7-cyano-7-deazaguanine synthase QueC [Parerythrobacter jejuensis]MXP30772.1 7-cyano-7-deazaguanine synthase QueC [Parerythrobacter jejuensis]MXP33532.1 7-cyano-7-deazaguanine synthase QueC [Parerythrobacter jejuensis]
MSGNSRKAAAVLLSGGLDSMVTAAIAREQGFAIHALSIDYGQRHRIELDAASVIATKLGAERHVEISLDLRKFGGSALTADIDVPKTGVADDIPVTYVPARNLVFLSLTTAFAEASGARDLFIGVNALDYSGYPDCRPEFIESFAATANLATKAGVEEGAPFHIHTPLQNMTKADIAREADRLGLDSAWSWSCYDPLPGAQPCGACDSCRLRRKGFSEAGLTDGLMYPADAPPIQGENV